jgi:uncharacterized lipoprotein YehR (DUF1307 family)
MKIFEDATKVLIEMNEECENLKTRFGQSSKLYQQKRAQVDLLIDMQDAATKKINELNNALRIATINNKALEMAGDALIESLAANIHTDQLFLLAPHGSNTQR